jgi:predicted RNase H-like HicB family nuclease
MSDNTDNLPLLHVDIVEYPQEKTFVAECLEVPIIVEAETFEKVEKKMQLAMTGYFETFPDEREVVLTSRRMSIPLDSPVQESGGRHLLMMPFPLSH